MAIEKVYRYKVEYNTSSHDIIILIYYKINSGHDVITVKLFVSPEEARFLVDLLRNEKPIWYDTENKILQTGSEDVGEGEK